MERLKNKVALVTGAADGIGLAIAQAFANEGATVVMGDVNEKKCKEECRKLLDSGSDALACLCDVGDTTSVKNVVKSCIEKYGKIDILVNNAAVSISGNIADMPEEDWDSLMNVNLKGVFRCIQACMPHMLDAQKGSIINLSSTQAYRSWADWTCYATAKGAILSMTNQLAGQFGNQNIRFNSISPGTIATPMLDVRLKTEGQQVIQSFEKMHAMERVGITEEVAKTAVFLASDESSFITGEDIKVDGGLCTLPRYL